MQRNRSIRLFIDSGVFFQHFISCDRCNNNENRSIFHDSSFSWFSCPHHWKYYVHTWSEVTVETKGDRNSESLLGWLTDRVACILRTVVLVKCWPDLILNFFPEDNSSMSAGALAWLAIFVFWCSDTVLSTWNCSQHVLDSPYCKDTFFLFFCSFPSLSFR